MKKITELVTSPEKPEHKAKRKAITFGSFKRAEDRQVAERKQREHDAELAVIAEEARIQRVLEEEEQKAIKDQNRRRRDKFITNSLSNAFGTKNEVDMTPVREQVIDRYLPKTALPEAEEYPTPFKDEPALNAELAEFKKKINEHLHTIGFASSGGGGIGSIADANDLVDGIGDGEFLQYRASDGKFIGATASVSTLALTALDIDGGTDIGAAIVDADLFVVDDGADGTNRKTAASRIKTYVADVTLTTAAQTNITSLGTLTALTVDNIAINGTNIGHTSDTDAIAIASDGVVTMNQIPVFSAGINVSGGTIAGTLATAAQTNITTVGTLTTLTVDSIIINGTNIGHTSDTDAIAIASDGVVTFSQVPVLPADTIETADIQDNAVTPAKIAGAVNAQTGTSYTSVIGDAFKTVTMSNGSANKLTIPPNSSVAYAVGDRIDVVMLGSGTTSIQGGSGVTVNAVSTGTVAIAAQFAAVSCLKIATDTWVAMGNHGGVS